jgi:hypothetical protein
MGWEFPSLLAPLSTGRIGLGGYQSAEVPPQSPFRQ